MGALQSSSYLISPGAALLAYTLLLLSGIVGGVVTLAKGRRGWFLVGLLTLGLIWNITAFLMATPDSMWARRFYDPSKMTRARARFGRSWVRPV